MAKNRYVRIMTVCGAGVGSSVMLRANILDLLNKYRVKGDVITADPLTCKGQRVDIVITQPLFQHAIAGMNAEIILLNNLVSMKELEAKLIPVLRKLGYI